MAMPSSETKKSPESTGEPSASTVAEAVPNAVSENVGKSSEGENVTENDGKDVPVTSEDSPWPERFNTTLKALLSEPVIEELKKMYLEGPEPPFVSDSGWTSRPAKDEGSSAAEISNETEAKVDVTDTRGKRGKRGRDRGRGRGRGRGGGAGKREDTRKVLSDVRLYAPAQG